jgi:hypothetical protein
LPPITVTCVVGGMTTVSWTHGGHVTSLDIEWFNVGGGLAGQGVETVLKGLQFSVMTPPTLASGGTVQVTASLSSGLAGRTPLLPCTG